MLVSVNYTIKFDEIPRTTQKSLTEDILLEMGLLCAEVEGAAYRLDPGNDQNIFKAMETIDKVRQGLTLADAKLRDCYSILSGYQQELLRPTEEEQSDSTTEELLSKLQETAQRAGDANR